MANQQHNKGGSNSNHGNKQGGGNPRPPKKTMAELAKEVIDTHFKELENDLLSLNDITKIKSIFFQLENFIKEVSSGLTTSQLRNVYGRILDAKDLLALQLIRPNLAYVAARNKDVKAKKVMALIDFLIQTVNEPKKHKSFNKVMEAMVAYHKFHYQPKEQEK